MGCHLKEKNKTNSTGYAKKPAGIPKVTLGIPGTVLLLDPTQFPVFSLGTDHIEEKR